MTYTLALMITIGFSYPMIRWIGLWRTDGWLSRVLTVGGILGILSVLIQFWAMARGC